MNKRLLLIGWDAADWNLLNPLIDAGELPALNRVVEKGVVGDLAGGQLLDTAAQWTSMVTGKRPWQHGIAHSLEFEVNLQQPAPITRKFRRCAAIWEMLAAHERRSIVFGWPATQGCASDFCSIVSNRYAEPTAPPGTKVWPPAPTGTYWPGDLGNSLDPLRMSPEALGADIISRYIPDWQKIDQKSDRRLGLLRVLLALDLSHCAGSSFLLSRNEWDFAAVRLPALGNIAPLFLPFHPPRREEINQREFDLYHNVMRIACRTLDHMLGIFEKLAGPDTVIMVASGHGVRVLPGPSGGVYGRPEATAKSPYGILTAAGPGFAPDRLLHGAGILDVTPTILHWFGLPIGDDMEGRVLLEGLSGNSEVQRIETWENVVPAFKSTGEMEPGTTRVAERLRLETRWNLAQSYLEAGRLEEALTQLKDLFRSFPERADICQALFQCQLNLGRLADAEETLEVLLESVPSGPNALLPQAELAMAKRDFRQAEFLAAELGKAKLQNPMVLRRLGLLLLHLRQWDALEELAREALKREENDPIAWLGLAEALLRQKKPAESAEAALRAIQLKYFLPDAHFILARALVAQGKWVEAGETMTALLKIQPANRAAAGYDRRLKQRGQPAAR